LKFNKIIREKWAAFRYLRVKVDKKNSSKDTKLIQIVGLPRSGTTLLASILNNHDDAICLVEPYLSWLSSKQVLPPKDNLIFNHSQLSLPPNDVINSLVKSEKYRIVGFKETYRTKRHKTFPSRSFLEKNQKEKRVDFTLVILRDPRDGWASVVKRHSKYESDFEALSEYVFAWNKLIEWIVSEKIRYVKYENLVRAPKETISNFDELGLDWETELTRVNPTTGFGDATAQEGGKINTKSIATYSDVLTKEVIHFIITETEYWFKHTGYQV